jgi:hypothetical protein
MTMEAPVNVDRQAATGRGLRMVCEACGSLSIRVSDPTTAPDTTVIHCGRCGADRGTLADLHQLARRSADLFEF